MGIFNWFKPRVKKLETKGDIEGLLSLLSSKKRKSWWRRHDPQKAVDALVRIGKPAVEPLIAILKTEKEDWVLRCNVLTALGKIGDARAVEPLIALLKDKDSYYVARAAIALGCIGDARAVEPLIAALMDTDSPDTVADIAEALGKIGDARAVTPIIDATKRIGAMSVNIYKEVRDKIANALAKFGEPSVDPLIAFLKEYNSRSQYSSYFWRLTPAVAVHALGKIGGAAVEPLIAILPLAQYPFSDEDPIVAALAKIGEPAVEPLIDILKTDEKSRRAEIALKVLCNINDPRVIEPLIDALQDGRADIETTLSALAKISWEPSNNIEKAYFYIATNQFNECVNLGGPAVEPLISVLRAEVIGRRASIALAQIGKPAVKSLVAALKSAVPSAKNEAAFALGEIGGTEVVQPLIEALQYRDPETQMSAVQALGKIGDARAIQPLIVTLRRGYSGARAAAAELLGKIGDARAVEPLIAALKDEDVSVRYWAAWALNKITGQDFGENQAKWKNWWAENESNFEGR